MPLASVQVETALLVLKIAFLVLLYLFIWRIVRSAARDLRLPQESMILSPQQASALLAQPVARELGRLVVVTSQVLAPGDVYTIDIDALTVGRGRRQRPRRSRATSTPLPRHARFEPRRDGIYVEDIGSTNGTYVNGDAADARPAPRARRPRPHRRDRPEVRAMKLVASFADTNTGRKRRHNEDAFVSEPPLFAVADGMGGAQAGEVASAIAADTLLEDARGSGAGGAAHVVELIQTANRRVYQRAHEDATASGMGTTMTVALGSRTAAWS